MKLIKILKYVSKSFEGTEVKYDSDKSYIDMLEGQVDSWSYIRRGIPAVMLSSGGFPEHHTLRDKIEWIDFEHLHMAAHFLQSFIVEIGNSSN